MSEMDDLMYNAADYRVRLFLSVDLSGSTAYKNSSLGEARATAHPKWVTTFENFYRDFPGRFRNSFAGLKTGEVDGELCPQLWKAVGDELVFCGRVTSQASVAITVNAFIKTLHDYRKVFLDDKIESLNLKGAGWLSVFPEPNRAVQLHKEDDDEPYLSASEALEKAADDRPNDFDFLGKAIDTGFRVASCARPERFVLSVQLARILVDAKKSSRFSYDIRFGRPVALKGVNQGNAYPMLYIDTMNHLPMEKVQVKERALLQQNAIPCPDGLKEYLQEYCEVVGTEAIALPETVNDDPLAPPASYSALRMKISEHLESEKGRRLEDVADCDPTDGESETILEKATLKSLGEKSL